MLKKRLAANLTIKNGHVVQSIQYKKFLPVGSPEVTVEFLSSWGVDEIIYQDIDASKNGLLPNFNRLKKCSKKCFVPLVYAGGIKTIEHIRSAIHNGADKVALNTVLIDNPQILNEAKAVFGIQCLIASIDLIENQGQMQVYDHRTQSASTINPLNYIEDLAKRGAGEVFMSFVSRNGMKTGLETEYVKKVRKVIDIPIIVAGGTGHPQHVVDCFQHTDANCIAVGNHFHFSEHSVQTMKNYLQLKGLALRSDSKASYQGFAFEETGRIAKLDDKILKERRFEIVRDEII